MKIIPIFRVRIVYKSGYTHDFDCFEFSITTNQSNGIKSIEWKPADDKNKPVYIGLYDIAAVWQIGYKHKIIWGEE